MDGEKISCFNLFAAEHIGTYVNLSGSSINFGARVSAQWDRDILRMFSSEKVKINMGIMSSITLD